MSARGLTSATSELEALEARLLLAAFAPSASKAAPNLSFLLPGDGRGHWVDFNPSDGRKRVEADFQVVRRSAGGLRGHLDVAGAWLDTVYLGGQAFSRLTFPEDGYAGQVGKPGLPVVRRLLTVPDGAVVTASITGRPTVYTLSEFGAGKPLVPVQDPIAKDDAGLADFVPTRNRQAYSRDSFAPGRVVRIEEAGMYKGQRRVLLEIEPLAYNPARGQLKVYSSLSVSLKFDGTGVAGAGAAVAAEAPVPPSAAKTAGGLLIIAHDSLAGGLTSFISHKTSTGYTVDLANTTTAGTSAAAIRTYIQGRYNNSSTRPTAVLLVGDTNLIPSFVGVAADSPNTDLYYACMDAGDDWQPEFPVGRFSVVNTAQLSAIVNKTIAYETAPAAAWMHKAAFLASQDNYSISEGTHDWVISNYMNQAGYASDKLYSHTYSATTAQVSAAFDDGRALGIYSGHGAETYWADGPVFHQSDVNALTNAGMYPFVASFACVTGNYGIGESFAETWQRADNKGAVAVLAASVNSYWTEDDILEKKLFDAIFADQYLAFGDAVLRAKQLYLGYFGAGGRTRLYFEMYNLLGDPTVELAGQELRVTSPATLPSAYADEPYSVALAVAGGQVPYTWQMTFGTPPAGLAFDPASATISGTPTATGSSSFTLRVTDAAGATDSRQFTLGVTTRLGIVTPTPLPPAAVNVPYSLGLRAGGGTGPYAWSLVGTGSYNQTQTPSAWTGGGTAQGWHADDQAWNLALPWSFPFYGTNYGSVYVSSNGLLDFGASNAAYSNSTTALLTGPRIAALWDDLRTDSAGEDIFVTSLSDRVIIRWAGHTYSNGDAVNVEAVLYGDGRIGLNYGAAHAGLTPTVGISRGDGLAYTLASLDGAGTIPANTSLLFTYAGQLPAGLMLNTVGGVLSGTPTAPGSYDFTVQVVDAGLPVQTVQRAYHLDVLAVSPTPGVPDLTDAADTGADHADNLTFRNNSTTGAVLEFQIGGVTSGATVTIYADGVAIGQGLAGGLMTTDGHTLLSDGQHVITATQTVAGLAESNPSWGLTLKLDTVAPTVTVQPRITADTTPPLAGTVNDAAAAVQVTIEGAVRPADNVGGVWTVPDKLFGPLGLAWHEVVVTATDAAGNVGQDASTFELRIALEGDADLSDSVTFDDYQQLEAAFGTVGGATWALGDFTGDGNVAFDDYQKLEVNFGCSVSKADEYRGTGYRETEERGGALVLSLPVFRSHGPTTARWPGQAAAGLRRAQSSRGPAHRGSTELAEVRLFVIRHGRIVLAPAIA